MILCLLGLLLKIDSRIRLVSQNCNKNIETLYNNQKILMSDIKKCYTSNKNDK